MAPTLSGACPGYTIAAMALIGLFGDKELRVTEAAIEVLSMCATAGHQGVMHEGRRVSPHGWLTLTAPELGGPIYVQASSIGYVREDAAAP